MTGALPKGWRRVRLKRMFSYAKGLNITKADLVDDGEAVVSYGQIHAKYNTGTHLDPSLIRYVPEEIAAAYQNSRLKKGDIVFADTSEDLDGVGNCVLNDSDGVVYAGYHALVARARFPEHSKYLSYLFQTDAWRGQIRTRASGIKVFSLTQRVLNPVTVILPPLSEQRRIAAFLDAKCADIDKAIAAKRKQLDLLDGMWKSILSDATRNGINSDSSETLANVRMGDVASAAGTLGDLETGGKLPNSETPSSESNRSIDAASDKSEFQSLPQGWRKTRIKSIFRIISGNGFKIEFQGKTEGDYPFAKASDIRDAQKELLASANYVTKDLVKQEHFNVIPAGSIIFAKIGEAMRKNNRAIAKTPCCVDNNCQGLVPNHRAITSDFAYYLLLCVDMCQFDNGGTIPYINNQQLKSYEVSLPPLPEQKRIAEYLDAKRRGLDELKDNLRRQIEVLEQYRKSLIHECVTGERRVG